MSERSSRRSSLVVTDRSAQLLGKGKRRWWVKHTSSDALGRRKARASSVRSEIEEDDFLFQQTASLHDVTKSSDTDKARESGSGYTKSEPIGRARGRSGSAGRRNSAPLPLGRSPSKDSLGLDARRKQQNSEGPSRSVSKESAPSVRQVSNYSSEAMTSDVEGGKSDSRLKRRPSKTRASYSSVGESPTQERLPMQLKTSYPSGIAAL